MRDPNEYLPLPSEELVERLATVTLELMHTYDLIGFLRSQELTAKRDTWVLFPDDTSVQFKDRAATYAAATHTIELQKAEADRNILIEERNFLTVLLKG